MNATKVINVHIMMDEIKMTLGDSGAKVHINPTIVEVTVDPEVAKKVDRNGDGHISQEEMEMNLEFKRKELEDADARRDAMRKMTWVALMGMLLYPLGILVTSMLGYEETAKIIGNIAPTYFVAISALVAAYFGANAYVDKKK